MVDIDRAVTQRQFATLVGVTQPAIAKHVSSGLLREGATLGEWLRAYCEKLRAEASGRASDDSVALTRAKTREAEGRARLADLQYYREVEALVPVELIEPMLESWAVSGRAEVTRAVESVVAAVESKYKIEVERELYEKPLYAALDAIAGYPRDLADTAEADID